MSHKTNEREDLFAFSGGLKFGKRMYVRLLVALGHIASIVIIIIFMSLFIPERFLNYFYDYVRALYNTYLSHELIMFSYIKNLELTTDTVLKLTQANGWKISLIIICALVFLYIFIYPSVNKLASKIIRGLAKGSDDTIDEGAVILEDDKYMEKYITLGKNNREDGIFVSKVYLLQEVDENGNTKEL
jgi:hypothetical protein